MTFETVQGPITITLDKETQTIDFYRVGHSTEFYFVPLDQVTTKAGLASWIAQLDGKAWVTDEVLGAFIRILSNFRDLHSLKG